MCPGLRPNDRILFVLLLLSWLSLCYYHFFAVVVVVIIIVLVIIISFGQDDRYVRYGMVAIVYLQKASSCLQAHTHIGTFLAEYICLAI